MQTIKTIRYKQIVKISFAVVLTFFFCTACGIINKLTIVDIPCSQEAMDDETSYRALGVGESVSLQNAHQQSQINAQHNLLYRFSTGIYSRDSIKIAVSSAKFTMRSIQNVCEKIAMDHEQKYHVYTAVKIPKSDISEREVIFVLHNGDTISVKLPENAIKK